MRKVISLGLLALTFSLFSGQLFAGKIQVCENQKEELKALGLYGLCNAYWNAKEGRAQDKILDNYNELADLVGGPTMPGLEPDTPDVPEVACPCWANGELDFANFPHACEISADFAHIEYDDGNVQYTTSAIDCIYSNFGSVGFGFSFHSTSPEEAYVCASDLVKLIISDFPDC